MNTRPLAARIPIMMALFSAGCAGGAGDGASAIASPSAAVPALPADADEASAAIIAEDVLRWTAELSDDQFEGRGPGTAGDTAARAWIIKELTQLGVQPAGADGSWEQAFDIVSVTASVPESWAFRSEGGKLNLERGTEFIAFSGVQESRAALDEAELVFVGYGIEAPEYDWDDYKGIDLSGKVLLMLNITTAPSTTPWASPRSSVSRGRSLSSRRRRAGRFCSRSGAGKSRAYWVLSTTLRIPAFPRVGSPRT